MYDDAPYARTRLIGTVVLSKKTPVLVDKITPDLKAVVVPVLQKKAKPFVVDCHELNVLDFTLGFVNVGVSAKFLSRVPLRRDWRQGLRPANVHSSQGVAHVEDIAKALLHRYPSFTQAVAQVKTHKVNTVAWCQDFALNVRGNLIWRYDVVGNINFTTMQVELLPKFKYLTTSLKEVTDGRCEVL